MAESFRLVHWQVRVFVSNSFRARPALVLGLVLRADWLLSWLWHSAGFCLSISAVSRIAEKSKENGFVFQPYTLARTEFENFNYTDTLLSLDTVSNLYFRGHLEGSYETAFRAAVEPYFLDAMALTLSRGAGAAYLE